MKPSDTFVRSWFQSSTPAALHVLEELGYIVRWRDAEWVECLLWRDGEQWLGRGPTRDAALANAVGLALPSHLARSAFDAWIAARVTTPVRTLEDVRPPIADATEPTSESVTTPAPVDEVASPATVDDLSIEAPIMPPTPAVSPTDDATRPEQSPNVAQVATPALAERSEPVRRSLAEIEREFDALRREAEQGIDEFAVTNASRQRLLLLVWAARGRSLVDEARGAESLEWRMRGFAAFLGDVTRELWPGSVHALNRGATPADCLNLLPNVDRVNTWSEVVDAARDQLDRIEARNDDDGCDDYGYADAFALYPPSDHPAEDLRQILEILEHLSGLSIRASTRDFGPPPFIEDHGQDLIRCAKHLRWLRGFTAFREWGRAVGRLRWLVHEAPVALRHEVRRLLSAGYCPPASWAHELGLDPAARQRTERKSALLARRPRIEANPSDESIAQWLREAFDAGADMPSPKIAACLAGFEPRLDAIQAVVLGTGDSRQLRRRMQKVVDCLRQPNRDVATARREIENSPQEPERSQPSKVSLEQRLLDAVLEHTRGRRAVVVTNRNDPDLDTVLRATFEFAELDHVESKPSRIQGISERVQSGTYDVVLVATGFQSHSTDQVLQSAARAAGVLYARVNRARRAACIHALARELGLLGRAS